MVADGAQESTTPVFARDLSESEEMYRQIYRQMLGTGAIIASASALPTRAPASRPPAPPEGESKNVSPLTEKTVGDQTLEPQALLRPCLQMKRDSPPLECWCLSSARFALSRGVILQRDGVFAGLQSRSPVALATPAASRCGPCLHVGAKWKNGVLMVNRQVQPLWRDGGPPQQPSI